MIHQHTHVTQNLQYDISGQQDLLASRLRIRHYVTYVDVKVPLHNPRINLLVSQVDYRILTVEAKNDKKEPGSSSIISIHQFRKLLSSRQDRRKPQTNKETKIYSFLTVMHA
jgi:hypothetical protein